MRQDSLERGMVLFFRVAMGWIFLHAGLGQVLAPHFSIVPFLSHTKTFHDAFAIFTRPGVAPLVSLLVSWGQVLVGLSLFFGAFVPLSAPFGILLMLLFWLAHMDWPFDDGRFYVFVGPDLLFAGIHSAPADQARRPYRRPRRDSAPPPRVRKEGRLLFVNKK